jgi:tetratricopeptide (TPR) repeat protein
MTRSRLAHIGLFAGLVVVVALALFFGGVLRESSSAGPQLISQQAAEDFKAGFSLNASTASLILQFQQTLRTNPKDEHSYVLLGLAYQQRARETGDPTYYTKSEGVLRGALALDSKDSLAVGGLGSLALSRHRFREGLVLGRKAVALNPSSARNYGVVGDALIELGRYGEAFKTFNRMNKLRPSLSSYARVSYGRELIGHTKGAITAMRLAVDAATDATEPTAWTHVQLGKLYWNHGRIDDAAREYTRALQGFPGYHYALDAMAQVEWARGHLRRAISLERFAVDAIPLPQYVAQLGDLYAAAGKPRLAHEQYALIGAIERLLRANGVRTDLETALFDVDHGVNLPRALDRARAAHAQRPSIDGDDILAWALARNGRCSDALGWSRHALRLGTQDALKFFHRGMIERCIGHEAVARSWFQRALRLNPHFSVLWTPTAERLAR